MAPFATFEHIASPKAVVPLAWLTALVLRRRERALETAVGTSIAVLAAELLKRCIARRRPCPFDATPWRSCPSGHSAGSTAYFIGLALMWPGVYREKAVGAAVVGAVAVNTMRVLSRRHWPTDVIAGDALGVAGLATAHLAREALRPPRSERT